MAETSNTLMMERMLTRDEALPSKPVAVAFATKFRDDIIKQYQRVSLSAVPFVSRTVTPYQWRWRGIWVIGFYLCADTFVRVRG